MENLNLLNRLMHWTQRLAMNVFGPADRTDADTPIIHRNDDGEMASQEQLADIEVERDNEGHSWGLRKTTHPEK
ncbi:hypothetical protein NFC73_19455 [Pseudarthrobacter sp. RMG13]|uniref:Uncharacterized protein n=1 Tax=Pseudarthrobacter humi TaxID=2952523 RepID=A0ABT1LTV1_9MICC|nr:hypothetical protein [Pseudarthrobacter humi]MCP9001887.1 hypothetical protein [Pseudarthrobacter humi]